MNLNFDYQYPLMKLLKYIFSWISVVTRKLPSSTSWQPSHSDIPRKHKDQSPSHRSLEQHLNITIKSTKSFTVKHTINTLAIQGNRRVILITPKTQPLWWIHAIKSKDRKCRSWWPFQLFRDYLLELTNFLSVLNGILTVITSLFCNVHQKFSKNVLQKLMNSSELRNNCVCSIWDTLK